jgi:hypothetical protein
MTSASARAAIAASIIAVTFAWVLPAGALDDSKPSFDGCGKYVKDGAADANDQVAGHVDEAEIENAWVKYQPAKGDEATTVNITIKNLSGSAPPPATSITYDATYTATSGTVNFVRAYVDFTSSVVFEYGHQEDLTVSTRYAYDGDTKGKLFTGADGVVQIVIPAAAGGKAGTTLKTINAEVQLGRTAIVPGAVNQSPTRGLSFQNDVAALGTWTVEPCEAAPAATTPGSGGGPAPTTQAGTLPLKLKTTKVKPAKAHKSVALKLQASQPVTKLGARLSKGKKVFGTGKLAKLSGAGTLKIKLSKALKKGTYQLAIAGTDAQGRRGAATFKLRVG